MAHTNRPYDASLAQEDLFDIERDLLPEEAARLLFLTMDDLPSLVLQKCIVRLTHEANRNGPDSFTQWASRSSSDGTACWKGQFLEGLALIGRIDILDTLGLDERTIDLLRQQPVHLSSLKVAVNTVCSSLGDKETMDLVQFVTETELRDRPMAEFPPGQLVTPALEMHILRWMQEGIMRWEDLSILARGLQHIGRSDLLPLLARGDRRETSQSAERSTSEPQGPSTGLGPVSSFIYPNGSGVCLVFNIETFHCEDRDCGLGKMSDHAARGGSFLDAQNMEQLFKTFRCQTRMLDNPTADDIEFSLEELSTEDSLNKFDFLVICFLSRGDMEQGKQRVYSSDCKPLLLDSLVRYFEADRCPAMSGKLKMVITYADYVDSPGARSDGPTEPQLPRATRQSDFLFCQATARSSSTCHISNLGSVYVQHLCHVLRDRGHLEELTLCIKDVHNLLMRSPILLSDAHWDIQMIDRTQGCFRFRRVDDING